MVGLCCCVTSKPERKEEEMVSRWKPIATFARGPKRKSVFHVLRKAEGVLDLGLRFETFFCKK